MQFYIEQDVLDIGVKIRGVQIRNVNNDIYTEELKRYISVHIQNILEHESLESIKENPIIKGFYDLHHSVNIPKRKNLPASENLLKSLVKKQEFYSINPIVDIYNIISMETKLALGAHDINCLNGNLTLRKTLGNENFIPLGQDEPKTVPKGVYSYIDDANAIVCYLEIRQVDKTKITNRSKNIFYIVQGNKQTPQEYIDEIAQRLIDITTYYCGGEGKLLEHQII